MTDNIEVVKFDCKKNYDMVVSWWNARGFPPVSIEALPTNGFVAVDAEGPICAGWLYMTDSCLTWLEWIVANPQAKPIRLAKGLSRMLNHIKLTADTLGYTRVFTSMEHRGLIKFMRRMGFHEAGQGLHLVWRND